MIYDFAVRGGDATLLLHGPRQHRAAAMRHGALVTGGASPLGAAICRRLAADGLHV